MIKWLGRQLSKGFDTDPEHINRVTVKDATVGFPILIVVIWVLMLPLLPLFMLIDLLEVVGAVVIVVSLFAVPVSLFMIIDGQATIWTWLLFVGSLWVLLGRYVFFPILMRHPSTQRFRRRFF